MWDEAKSLNGGQTAAAAHCTKQANLGSHLAEVVTGG